MGMSKKREREIRLRAIVPALASEACVLPAGAIGRAFASLAIVGHVLGCIFTEKMIRQGFAAATWPWAGFTFDTFVAVPSCDYLMVAGKFYTGWHVRCQTGDKPSVYRCLNAAEEFVN